MKKRYMSMAKTTKTTITLPVDLIKEILSYLPAKSLLERFKLVCESWRSIIKEPDFVMMHLNRGAINGGGGASSSNGNNNNYQSLMCQCTGNIFRLQLPFNVPLNSNDDTVLPITPTKLDIDSSLCRHWKSKLVCSCNGLLCIDNGQESLLLLNPCTREHKFSPIAPLQYRDKASPISYGFGCFYDSTTTTTTTTTTAVAEYKVVRIEHTFPLKSETTSSKSEVKVYSLATNSWRTIQDIPGHILEMITKTTHSQPGVFLNGALHWMNHETSDLVSIDMRSEEFRIMPRPPYDDGIKVLMIMRGCLGMIRIDSWDLEILIMKEYGVSTWTHEFVIRLSTTHVGIHGLGAILWLDDQILFEGIGRDKMVVYDMNQKMTVYIGIQNAKCGTGPPHVCVRDMVPCIESLVSLKSSQLTLSKDKKRKAKTIDTEIKQ